MGHSSSRPLWKRGPKSGLLKNGHDADLVLWKQDPRYTSQKCSKCGFTSRDNRKRANFDCQGCGFRLNADLNASRNIVERYFDDNYLFQLAQGAIRTLGGDPIIIPNVTSQDSYKKKLHLF